MYILDAQQPLGMLCSDTAELSEHSHDLQEQEPVHQSEERLGVRLLPWKILKLHEIGGEGRHNYSGGLYCQSRVAA